MDAAVKHMRVCCAIIALGLAMPTLASCVGADVDVPPRRGIDADIDASRTQRGDSLYPDSTIPHHRPGFDRYY
jgi:hypothetical protein